MRRPILLLAAVLLVGRAVAAQADAPDVDPATRWAVVRQLGDEAVKNMRLVRALDRTVSSQVAKAKGTLVPPEQVERAVAQIDAEVVQPAHLAEIAEGVDAAHVLLVSIQTDGDALAVRLHRYEVNTDLCISFAKVSKPGAAAKALKKGFAELMTAGRRRQTAAAAGGDDRRLFGATISILQPRTAKELGLKAPRGALVAEVKENGLAAGIGLQVGDVITKYGNRQIKAALDLHAAIVEVGPGQAAPIEVWRDRAKVELEPPAPGSAEAGGEGEQDTSGAAAKAEGSQHGGSGASIAAKAGGAAGADRGQANEAAAGAGSDGAAPNGESSGAVPGNQKGQAEEEQRRKLGVRVRTVTDASAAELGLPYTTGALVIVVRAGGAGADAGVRVNDVILSIGGTTVTAARELSKIVDSSLAYRPIPMEVWRDGQSELLEVFFGIPKEKDAE